MEYSVKPLQKAQLISFITGESLDTIRLYPDSVEYDKDTLASYIKRLHNGESIGRITGKRWFYNHEFFINNTLEPRSDSETLIDAVIELYTDKDGMLKIFEIGTGSGCLLLSLLCEFKQACGIGIDICPKTLDTARKNIQLLELKNRATVYHDNIFNLKNHDFYGDFDLIISNPPYIKTDEIPLLDDNVKLFDPIQALDGGVDGLDYYRIIFQQKNTRHIIVEIGINQEQDIKSIANINGYKLLKMHKDLGGIVRVLSFKKL